MIGDLVSYLIEDLFEIVSKNKESLREKISKLMEKIDAEKVKAPWLKYLAKEKNINHAASDGSANFIEYKGFVLYVIAAKAIGKINDDLIIESNFDIDILHPYRKTADRIRFYMSMFEKKVSLKFLQKHKSELFILDGSILGDLIRPAAYERLPNKVQRKFIIDNYLEIIRKSIESNEFHRLLSKDYTNEIIAKTPKNKIDSVIYLEYLENLLTLKELLQHEDTVIGISKTSRTNNYFRNIHIPDMAIFEEYCRIPGFSKPISVELENLDRYKRRFPILDEEIREIPISLFYARFTKKSPVLKFEYIGEPDKERAKEILDILALGVVEGYPYLLRKAHREVLITRKNIEQIAKILGLYEKTGREML